jgi:hypothetical protein
MRTPYLRITVVRELRNPADAFPWKVYLPSRTGRRTLWDAFRTFPEAIDCADRMAVSAVNRELLR